MNLRKIFGRQHLSPKLKIQKENKMSRKNKDMIVKVARTGSKVIDVCLNGEHTVKDALLAAGLNVKASEEIRVNKEVVEDDYELSDGDIVVLAKNISGGSR